MSGESREALREKIETAALQEIERANGTASDGQLAYNIAVAVLSLLNEPAARADVISASLADRGPDGSAAPLSAGEPKADDVKALIAEARQTCARMEAADFELSLRILVADLADALERASSPSVTLDELRRVDYFTYCEVARQVTAASERGETNAGTVTPAAAAFVIRALADVLASRGGER